MQAHPLIIGALILLQSVPSIGRPDIGVTAAMSDGQVEFRLVLRSPTTVQVYRADLPGVIRGSIMLVAVTTSGEIADQSTYFDDPGPGIVTLVATKPVTKRVDLRRWFPSLDRLLTTSDMILFWNYQLKTVDGRVSNRVGGWLFLPKKPGSSRQESAGMSPGGPAPRPTAETHATRGRMIAQEWDRTALKRLIDANGHATR